MAVTDYEATYYDSRELENAWMLLPLGPEYVEHGETWQYMGSRVKREPADQVIAYHTFRHRCFRGESKYVHVREDARGLAVVGPKGMD